MDIQRTIPIVIEPDKDLERTLEAFREVQHALSEPCYKQGKPLGALALQRLMYHTVKGTLNAQMTISAIRTGAGAYQSAKSNKKPATGPFLLVFSPLALTSTKRMPWWLLILMAESCFSVARPPR